MRKPPIPSFFLEMETTNNLAISFNTYFPLNHSRTNSLL